MLSRLEAIDPQQGRVVELRYFGGMTVEESAEVLGVSLATVKRDWSVARAWLYARAGRPGQPRGARELPDRGLATGLAEALEGSGDLAASLRARQRVIELRRGLLKAQPSLDKRRRELALDQYALGATLARLRRWAEAREAYAAGLELAAGGQTPAGAADKDLMDRLRAGPSRVADRTAKKP